MRATGRVVGSLVATAMLGAAVPAADAAIIEFSDKLTFQAATGATSVIGALPNVGAVAGNTFVDPGDLRITISPPSSALFIGALGIGAVPGDWYGIMPGHDIAISDRENLNFDLLGGARYSFGFDFAEPNTTMPSYGGSPVDSTFLVTLKHLGVSVGSFSFNRPEDSLQFVGFWTDFAFDRVEITETVGGIDDEYFGEVYAGSEPIPEPMTLLLFGTGLSGLALRRRARR